MSWRPPRRRSPNSTEQAREQADRDPVTGLLSRRAVFEGLERRLASARERSGKLALLMIDIDGFKLFNDTYGHLAGDSVLRLVSKEITARTRDGDLAGRFGGDEILMVLPNTDTEGAIAQAGRLLDATNAITWVAPDGTDVPVSLSVGVAAYPGHALRAQRTARLRRRQPVRRQGARRGGPSPRELPPAVGRADGYGFGMLDSLITALQEKDQYTRRHSEEVASIAVRMAEALGLDDRTLRAIRIAGLLHDVGKTGIPASLLMRPGQLTEQESDLMRRHVDIGLALIRDVPELDEVLAAVGAHHEHIDGSGYPQGLKGDRIPLTGRILAVADTLLGHDVLPALPAREARRRGGARTEDHGRRHTGRAAGGSLPVGVPPRPEARARSPPSATARPGAGQAAGARRRVAADLRVDAPSPGSLYSLGFRPYVRVAE